MSRLSASCIQLSPCQKEILVLLDALDSEGWSVPTLAEIGLSVGFNHSYVRREIAGLRELGLVEPALAFTSRQTLITNHGRSTARRILRDNPWPLVPEAFDHPNGSAMLPVYEWHVGDVEPSGAMPRVAAAAELELASA